MLLIGSKKAQGRCAWSHYCQLLEIPEATSYRRKACYFNYLRHSFDPQCTDVSDVSSEFRVYRRCWNWNGWWESSRKTLKAGTESMRKYQLSLFSGYCRKISVAPRGIFEAWLTVFWFLILTDLVLAVFVDITKLFQCCWHLSNYCTETTNFWGDFWSVSKDW